LVSRSVLPSRRIDPSLIAEKVSDIRSIDLRARLKTNLWHILGRISAWIYFLHLGYIYYGGAYTLDVALQYLKITVIWIVMPCSLVDIDRRF
jgi:hypothetical protein